jgi:hypothetical protein
VSIILKSAVYKIYGTFISSVYEDKGFPKPGRQRIFKDGDRNYSAFFILL